MVAVLAYDCNIGMDCICLGSTIYYAFVDPSQPGLWLNPNLTQMRCSETIQTKVRQWAPLWLQAANLTLTELTSHETSFAMTARFTRL